VSGETAIYLSVLTLVSPADGMAYLALFAAGSIVGMTLLSAVVTWPLYRSRSTLASVLIPLKSTVGILSIGLGAGIMLHAGQLLTLN
jgi:hypothetical protein